MSEDRLVSSRELACAFRNIAMSYATDAMNTDGAERVLNEYAYEVTKNIAEGLESGKIGLTVDAVPREEHELLVRRLEHLEAERDAAIADLREMAQYVSDDVCTWCDQCDCERGCQGTGGNRGFNWRGVQKEVDPSDQS